MPQPETKYALVHKEREGHRIKSVTRRVVLGDGTKVERALQGSTASTTINTAGVDRENGKLRAGSSRLHHKTHAFAREKRMMRSGISLSPGSDHYCRSHKSL